MREIAEKERWYFVDEAGDPNFYGKGKKVIVGTEGCSRIFALGYLRTSDPQLIRDKLTELRTQITNDQYLSYVPSVKQSMEAFHAKDDCPEVRYLVYKTLQSIDFRAQIIVARKKEKHFQEVFNGSTNDFCDRLVRCLFRNQLHIASENRIIFSRRGQRARQKALTDAVQAAVHRFWEKHPRAPSVSISVGTDRPLQEPVLQAADYVLWAVQRAYEKREMRYYEFLREKIQFLWDIYDDGSKLKRNSNHYDRIKNPFHIDKTSPLS